MVPCAIGAQQILTEQMNAGFAVRNFSVEYIDGEVVLTGSQRSTAVLHHFKSINDVNTHVGLLKELPFLKKEPSRAAQM